MWIFLTTIILFGVTGEKSLAYLSETQILESRRLAEIQVDSIAGAQISDPYVRAYQDIKRMEQYSDSENPDLLMFAEARDIVVPVFVGDKIARIVMIHEGDDNSLFVSRVFCRCQMAAPIVVALRGLFPSVDKYTMASFQCRYGYYVLVYCDDELQYLVPVYGKTVRQKRFELGDPNLIRISDFKREPSAFGERYFEAVEWDSSTVFDSGGVRYRGDGKQLSN